MAIPLTKTKSAISSSGMADFVLVNGIAIDRYYIEEVHQSGPAGGSGEDYRQI